VTFDDDLGVLLAEKFECGFDHGVTG